MARYDASIRDEARRLHAEGMTHTEIARRLGVHRTTVHYMVGKPSARPNATAAEETAARMRAMRDAGMTHTQIAAALSTHRATVVRMIGPAGSVKATGHRLSPETARAMIARLRDGRETHRAIAEAFGVTRSTVGRQWRRAIAVGVVSSGGRVPAHMVTDETRATIVEMRRAGKRMEDIATALDISPSTVQHQLRVARSTDPTVPKPGRIPKFRDEAHRKQVLRERRAARPAAPKRVEPIVHAPRAPVQVSGPPPLVKAEDKDAAAIAAAIQAGIGRRYEITRNLPGRQVQTADDAVALMRERGFAVEIKSSSEGRLRRYRVTGGSPFDDRWLLPHAFCTAVRTFAAQSTYRVVPLREAYSSHAGA